MLRNKVYILLIIFLLPIVCLSQKSYIKGVVLDINNNPIENVNITSTSKKVKNGVTTNINGFYSIEIDALEDVHIIYSHVNYKNISYKINLKINENVDYELITPLGQRIFKGTLRGLNKQINLSQLDQGLYYLCMNNQTIKVIKQN